MTQATTSPSGVTAALTPEDRSAISTYLIRLEQLQRSNNWQALTRLMTEDCVTMPPRRSAVEGRGAWLQWIHEKQIRVIDLSLRPVEFEGCGDLAFARCDYRWTYQVGGQAEKIVDSGKFMGVLRKQLDDKWLATHWMWNSDLRRRTTV